MTYPQTSQTPQVGFIRTPTANTGMPITNPGWVDAFVKYWTARWDSGDRSVPQGWVSALDGEPDDKLESSPRTVLAFTRYAMRYRPGTDPNVDQVMPWVPPGPNDYIEDPVVKAARIADEQWQKTFDEGTRQFGLTFDQQERENLRRAFNDAWQAELTKYATAANIFSTQTQAALNAYNTQAGIYNANEQNAGQRLSTAGSLASALQQMQDARTQAAIKLKADPADYVEQAYATRALGSPQGTQTPAFKDVDALTEVIRRLIDYKPAPAPQAPVINGGQPIMAPQAPTQGTFTPPQGAINPFNPNPSPNPAPTSPSGPKPGGPLPVAGQHGTNQPITKPTPKPPDTTTIYGQPARTAITPKAPDTTTINGQPVNPNLNSTLQNPAYTDPSGNIWNSATQRWMDKQGNAIPGFAEGTNPIGTAARQMIVGDPQMDGAPNPEVVEVMNPGPETRTRVTPLRDTENLEGGSSEESIVRILVGVLREMLAGGQGGSMQPASEGSEMEEPYESEMLPPHSPEMLPKYAYGTDSNNPMLTTYNDEVYQNLPHIRYMQGSMNRGAFNTLAKGYATGAMGQQVPEAGSFNFRRYLDVARDPVALAMLSSDYKSANRDLASTLARAKARAPFGQALNTSIVKT